MRDITENFRKYVLDLENDDQTIWLLSLSCGTLAPEFLICTHSSDVISNGKEFISTAITIKEPKIAFLKSRTTGTLTIENVSRKFVEWIRVQCITKPKVSMELILLSDPNVIEYGPIVFDVDDVKFDASKVTMPLVLNDFFKQPFQTVNFDPSRCPGLFV